MPNAKKTDASRLKTPLLLKAGIPALLGVCFCIFAVYALGGGLSDHSLTLLLRLLRFCAAFLILLCFCAFCFNILRLVRYRQIRRAFFAILCLVCGAAGTALLVFSSVVNAVTGGN